ncbi:MAG: thiol peroxidase [Bdellovibrionales bacterium]|nr:thiol peroxidase [Bdellovibrionales bacterium]
MAKITLKGNTVNTSGDLPTAGGLAPGFRLVKTDLSEATLDSYAGKRKVLNIFPSVDTPTCAMSVRQFNQRASDLSNTVVLNISADLPFALKRFCGVEGIQNAEALSSFRSAFSKEWNLEIVDGPLKGLCSRSVIVLDENNKVLYSEQVAEIATEPNYDAAIASLT